MHEAHGFVVRQRVLAQMKPAHTDGGNHLVRASEPAIQHVATALAGIGDEGQGRRIRHPGHGEGRAAERSWGLVHRGAPYAVTNAGIA